jgi:YbbR domain-containing protein
VRFVMNWLYQLFTQNVGLKLISLVTAIILWTLIASDPITEASFRVPVEFVNVPPKLEVLTNERSVRVWARGPSRAIRRASAADFSIRVDVGGVATRNEATYLLALKDISVPPALEVKELIPDEVTVSLDQTASKEVPILPRFSGEPQPGFRLKGFELSPTVAKISGPSSHLESITSVSTALLDLSNISQGETMTATVAISDPLVRFIQPQSVRIKVQLEKAEVPIPSRSATPGS